MTTTSDTIMRWMPAAVASGRGPARDAAIDGMRGIAILMVIGIHSLPKADGTALVTVVDAALRPCVAIFLFASGYLTARSGRVPLGKRLLRALGPYTVAFLAAYLVMAAQNPLIDNRPAVFVARYALAYVFVYYYVFVYIGCTVLLALTFAAAGHDRADRQLRLIALLSFVAIVGLAAGAYLDPVLQRFGLAAAVIEEVRMRDVPFWFGLMAAGVLVGQLNTELLLRQWRTPLISATVLAYAAYALVRVFGVGDSADYDSIAFFAYALLACLTLLALAPRGRLIGFLGSASYAIYLWHIFAIVLLRPHLAAVSPLVAFLIKYGAAFTSAVGLVVAAKSARAPRLAQWLGA